MPNVSINRQRFGCPNDSIFVVRRRLGHGDCWLLIFFARATPESGHLVRLQLAT